MKKNDTNNKAEEKHSNNGSGTNLVAIIETAIKIPGVRVDRDDFLKKQFAKSPADIFDIIIKQ